ncbi:hypothetical protein Hanom_Chr09g00840691 [Helianthus anomalus]
MNKNTNLASTILDNNVAALADGTSLLRISLGSSGIGLGFKLVLFVRHVFRWRMKRRNLNRTEDQMGESSGGNGRCWCGYK